ncbi:MAG: class I SAM-dependent methyltransferase [Syntrophotalea sp.]|uniref:class I SAM-dependent methyltransferase n=1 Tax=Syntrophotalea sp. TaxID=2812029 RepID=UPI003D0BA301
MSFHFDLLSRGYDQFLGRTLGAPDMEYWRTALGLPVRGRLLDAGGGTGRVSAALRPDVEQVVIVDCSQGMLRQARKKGNMALVRADVAGLPFTDASFERALIIDALHHFPLQKESIAEVARVLAPGGLLVIEEFDIRRWGTRAIALAEKIVLMGSRFPTPEEIRHMLKEAGFSVLEIQKGKWNSLLFIAKK